MSQNISLKDKTFKLQKESSIDSESFCAEYLKLYSECFGCRSYITKEWFKWYNLDNPLGVSNIFTARNIENNEIAASYTLSPFITNFNSILVNSYLCCNVMTSPSYSGMGLFTQIGQYALENVVHSNELVIGIPNESAIKGHLKVGWQVMPNLYFIEKRKLDFTIKVCDAYVTENYNELGNYDFGSFNKNSDFNLQKNYPFLKWRYADNPKNNYRFVISKTDNVIDGYAVIKIYFDEISKLRKVHIVEYSYHELNKLKKILWAIENYAFSINADLINVWNFCQEESPVFKIFTNEHYMQTNNSNHFIIYSKNVIAKEYNNWQIMLGDNDVF